MKYLVLLLSIFVLPMFVGCGNSNEFSANSFSTNNQFNGLPVLSGQTGQLQLQTQLASNQVLSQTIQVLTGTQVPVVVDEFRILGFNSDGILIYGPVVRPKAGTVNLSQVPIEVVRLRIELLTDGFIVGGVTLPVNILSGQTFTINNPTYVFPVGATGPQGPQGPPGEPGEPGSTGTPVYGGFSGSSQFIVSEGDNLVNFPNTETPAVGITVSDEGQRFQVSQAGDYLITYTLVVSSSASDQSMVVRVNDGFDAFFTLNGAGSYTAQFVLSLAANDEIRLSQDGGITGVNIDECFFTIVRLGDSVSN